MVEPSSGGRARRDHGTRVIEPVETQWPVEPAETERGGRACRDHGTRVVDPVETTLVARARRDKAGGRDRGGGPGGRARRDHHPEPGPGKATSGPQWDGGWPYPQGETSSGRGRG